MPGSTDFARMVPGFDFLQGLVKSAGAGLPNISQWIAPTLDADELEKRIEELRTVQFWLEQNARMLGATIQALEVQRMTLSTLKTMNLPLAELRKSMELKAPAPAFAPPAPAPTKPARAAAKKSAASAPGNGAVDPMQWWGALTKQFTELAASALKDTAAERAKNSAGSAAKPSLDAAGPRPSAAAAAPAKAARAPRKRSEP